MSTDLRAPNNPNPNISDTSDLVEEKKKVFDLSLTQVAGGASAPHYWTDRPLWTARGPG